MDFLQRTLECVFCLENVVEPRMCSHCSILFCNACIRKWVDTVGKSNCPHCSNDDVHFEVEVPFVSLIQQNLEQRMKAEQDLEQRKKAEQDATNNDGDAHHDCPENIFCNQCKQHTCALCAKLKHANHSFQTNQSAEPPGAVLGQGKQLQMEIASILAMVRRSSKDLNSINKKLEALANQTETELNGIEPLPGYFFCDLERKLREAIERTKKTPQTKKGTKKNLPKAD